jgi:dihydrofolate synthase/folylpolyglutamate synthase
MIFDCRPGVRRLAGGFSAPLVTSALTWLYSVQQFGIKPGLANTRRLLRELALPGARQKFLHVAGTNGKGSTCAFIESILRTAGERTGLFTSPHLVSFCERMRCGGRMIELEEAEQGIEALRAVVSGWDPHPTFFELTMALALDWMDRSGAEVVVLETGMGGRLDATNALTPLVSVITPIAMDHQQWLGNSIAEIAAEKAGIIKPGIPVVSAPQHPAAAEVIRAAAEYSGSALTVVEEPWPGPLPLAGEHQRWNAAVAVAAVREAGFRLPHEILVRGLAATAWPGRFQMLPGRRVVLDGSHNPHGTEATVATWKQ